MPTSENPADLGSRGQNFVDGQLRKKGLTWLSDPPEWPQDVLFSPTPESLAEAETKQEILTTAMTENDPLDHLLNKYPLKTVLRIGAWIYRFIYNCQKKPGRKQQGLISTQEVEQQELWWIKQTQKAARHSSQFQADQFQLKIQLDGQQVLECRGRIIREYTIYLPDNHPFTQKLFFQAHLATLHGGVGLTIAKVRGKYYVPSEEDEGNL